MLQLGITSLNAQNNKFGKVSIEELQEQFNPQDSAANATILYRKEYIKYDYSEDQGFVQKREVHERIKIYNEGGFDWATKRIKLSERSKVGSEEVSGLKGISYNLIEGKIEREKLKKDGVFEHKKNDFWKEVMFTMPKIKKGCVIEYKYTIESPYIQIDDISFQEIIPIKILEVKVRIPEYFNFKKTLNPRASYLPKLKDAKTNRTVKIKTKDRIKRSGYSEIRTIHNSSDWSFNENITEANVINVPALKKEKFVDNLNNYRAKLILEYVSYKDLNGQIKNYATNWDAVTKSIYENDLFGRQLDKINYFKEDIDVMLQSTSTNANNIVNVFNYVKSKVKWNEFIGVYAEKGVRKAYKEGIGNVADINLMLIGMLRYAGIDANPVLVSTKNNGVPLFPTRQGFNYVICGVEVNNEVILFDATKEFTTANILPQNILNWQGRMIRKHGSSTWVNLTPKKNSNNTTMVSVTLNSDLVLEGKVRNQKTDYYAYDYRNEYAGLKNTDLIKNISKDKGDIEISNLVIKNEKELNKSVMNSYDFSYEDGAEEIGNEIYLSPLLFLSKTENIFNQENRAYPIDFNFPRTKKNMININIPEGYRVKSIPESVKLLMSDDLGEYSFLVKQNGNTIQVSELFKLNFPIVPVAYYSDLKEVYKKLIEKNTERIVLEKI